MTKARRKKHQQSSAKAADDEHDDDDGPNKPRNLLVVDATQPFTFSFRGRYGIQHVLTIQQTPDEETWPGGALWDCGLLLAQALVAIAGGGEATVTLTTRTKSGKAESSNRKIALPARVMEALDGVSNANAIARRPSIVLELGCGVGLTGMVAAAALHATVTVLTDLEIVVKRVSQPNVVQNSAAAGGAASGRPRTINNGQSKVLAVPLCWGNKEDQQAVTGLLQRLDVPSTTSQSRRKKKGSKQSIAPQNNRKGLPDIVLIGDVAYQHRPGAPSHFDALLSTLLNFVDEETLVLFGTRIRMAASADLLDLFREHFNEIVEPPLRADEVDSSFSNLKHNMTIHFMKLQTGHSYRYDAVPEATRGTYE